MKHATRVHAALIALLFAPAPLFAQPSVYAFIAAPSSATEIGTQVFAIDTDRPALTTSLIPALSFFSGPYFTPDGGTIVWSASRPDGTSALVLRNTLSGALSAVGLPLHAQFAGNPTRPEVYSYDATGVYALTAAGVRRFADLGCVPMLQPSVSGDGRRVSVHCASDATVRVADTATGTAVGVLPSMSRPALGVDGLDIYGLVGQIGGFVLRRYSVDSGALLAEVPLAEPAFSVPVLSVDPKTGHVYAAGGNRLRRFDGQSLAPLGSLAIPGLADHIAIDPARPRAYVLSVTFTPAGPERLTATIIDTDTFAPILSGQLPADLRSLSGFGIGVAPRPAAPISVTSSIQGRTVRLSWTAGSASATVLRYVVEAGTGPGLANIATSMRGRRRAWPSAACRQGSTTCACAPRT